MSGCRSQKGLQNSKICWNCETLLQKPRIWGLWDPLSVSTFQTNRASKDLVSQDQLWHDLLHIPINSTRLPMEWESLPLSPTKNWPPFFQLTSPATPHFGQVPTSVVGDQSHNVSGKLPPRILWNEILQSWLHRSRKVGNLKMEKLVASKFPSCNPNTLIKQQYQRLSLQKTKTNDTKEDAASMRF